MNQHNKHFTPVALVTGAGKRIGAAIAQSLHYAGYRVIIHCFQSHEAAKLLASQMNRRHPDTALVIGADLNEQTGIETLFKETIIWGKRLDVLVNNASIFCKTSSNPFADAEWDRLFNIHVKAPFLLSHYAYPFLAEVSGSIVNITDIHANKPLKQYAAYCQSKAALAMQTQALAREFAPEVRVNAVAPGAIAWPEGENTLTEEIQQNIIFETPLKQHGDSRFVAQAVLSLVDNLFVTGQTLHVDGGRSIR